MKRGFLVWILLAVISLIFMVSVIFLGAGVYAYGGTRECSGNVFGLCEIDFEEDPESCPFDCPAPNNPGQTAIAPAEDEGDYKGYVMGTKAAIAGYTWPLDLVEFVYICKDSAGNIIPKIPIWCDQACLDEGHPQTSCCMFSCPGEEVFDRFECKNIDNCNDQEGLCQWKNIWMPGYGCPRSREGQAQYIAAGGTPPTCSMILRTELSAETQENLNKLVERDPHLDQLLREAYLRKWSECYENLIRSKGVDGYYDCSSVGGWLKGVCQPIPSSIYKPKPPVINNPPSAVEPFEIGPVYQEQDGSFKFEKRENEEKDSRLNIINKGWLIGNNIADEVAKIIIDKGKSSIRDDNTELKDLKIGLSTTADVPEGDSKTIPFKLFKVPSGEGEGTCEGKEELPVRKEFFMKLTDDGTSVDGDGKLVQGEVKYSKPIKASALFCPNGELQLIKDGFANVKIGGGEKEEEQAEQGKIAFIVNKAGVNINNGDCNPVIEFDLKFEDMGGIATGKLLEYLPAYEMFDIHIRDYSLMKKLRYIVNEYKLTKWGVQNNIFFKVKIEVRNKELVGNIRVTGNQKELRGIPAFRKWTIVKEFPKTKQEADKINFYKPLDEEEAMKVIINIIESFKKAKVDWSKIKDEETKAYEKLKQAGLSEGIIKNAKAKYGSAYAILEEVAKLEVDIHGDFVHDVWQFQEVLALGITEEQMKKIKPMFVTEIDAEHIPYYPSYEEAIKNRAQLINDRPGLGEWDYYWFYSHKETAGNKIIYKQKSKNGKINPTNPLEITKEPINFEGCDAEKTTWKVFGERALVKIFPKDSNKPYLDYLAEKPLKLGYWNADIFPDKSKTELFILRKQIKGNSFQDGTFADFNSDWDLNTILDITKLYNYDEILNCCPYLNEKYKELKENSRIKEKTQSIYYLFESNESFNYEGIAYQFLPPYDFSEEVTKYFNLGLFEYPVYFKEDDSLLNNCQYEVLGEVKKIIGHNGGEIVLPDEINNVDKVLEVKEIIPENALNESVEFSIRRINITNCVCHNGIRDNDETGIDCGGRCGDCEETCYDGIQNQDETGIDVGGVCVIGFISDAEELCEWDLNQDGKVKQCVECTKDKNCSSYNCGGYNPVCRGGQCDCLTFDFDYRDTQTFLTLLKNAAKGKFYENDGDSLSNFLSVIRGWVKGSY